MAENNTAVAQRAGNNAAEPKPEPGIEYGVRGNLPFASWYDTYGSGTDTSDGVTVGNDPANVPLEKLVEMRRHDGQARALIRLLTLPIRAALSDSKWIEPPDGDAEDETEFANNMWNLAPAQGGMTVPKTKVLKQTLLALCDGFAVFEEVRQVPDDGPLKGKITLRKLAYRDAKTILFRVDSTGGFAGVRQIASVAGRTVDVVLKPDKVLFYSANEEENPMYGVSMFEAAYYHYEIKKKLYYIAHLGAQFAAVPGRVVEVDHTPDFNTLQSVKKAISDFSFNTSAIMPRGYKLVPFNGNTNFNFLQLIDHHNSMMAASVLAKFMQQEDRQVLIDNGKADATADMFVLAIESIMNEIAEVWSMHLMPKYIDWNFNSKKYPVFRFGQLTDTARDAIKELFQAVVVAGTLNCTPEFVRQLEEKLAQRLGLDIDYEEIEQHEEEQARSEAEADEAQAQLEQEQAATGLQPGADGTPPGPKGPGGGEGPQPVAAPVTAPTTKRPTSDQIAASGLLLDVGEVAEEILRLMDAQVDGVKVVQTGV